MLPLTKLIRTVGGGFERKKVVQTVTWLSDLPKKFAMRVSMSKCSKCQSTSHGLSRYSTDPVFVIGSKLTGIHG